MTIAWLRHHFVMPDPLRTAKRDLAEVRIELLNAHSKSESAKHDLARLLEKEERLSTYVGDNGTPAIRRVS